MTLLKRIYEKTSKINEIENYIFPCSKGELVSIENIDNSVFSSKILGDGFGIITDDEIIISPVKGTVKNTTNDGCEITIKTDDGLMILICLGMNLLKNKDKCVEWLVSVGDVVNIGEKLCTFTISNVMRNGFKMINAVVITNSERLKQFRTVIGKITDINMPIAFYTV